MFVRLHLQSSQASSRNGLYFARNSMSCTSLVSLKVTLIHQAGSVHFSWSNSRQVVPWHFHFRLLLIHIPNFVSIKYKVMFSQPLVNWWIKHDVNIKSNKSRVYLSRLTVSSQLLCIQWFWRIRFWKRFSVSV